MHAWSDTSIRSDTYLLENFASVATFHSFYPMQEMMEEVDLDGDGKIQFEDFAACLVCGVDVVPKEVRLLYEFNARIE